MILSTKEVHTINDRYQVLDKIGEGSIGDVYRVYDRLRDKSVALKIIHQKHRKFELAVQNEQHLMLANEFRILASLRHPHIISVLDYGFDDGQIPFFTMNLVEGARKLTLEFNTSMTNRIRIVMELLTALSFLHHRGIIHRDLKPENVLVNKDGHIKVLDFGLALFRQYSAGESSVSGTLSYMAPEVLQGEPASIQSDLYSVGIMAYELFTGKYPYRDESVSLMLYDILHHIPDMSQLDDELTIFLGRLVAKDPHDRYQDIESTINDFSSLMKYSLENEKFLFSETVLQSTKLVGRESELHELKSLIPLAKASRGSFYLIQGESGVGKTRLLNEIRIHALIHNLVVMQGNAMQGKKMPYGAWQEILKWLLLLVEITPYEASVLKMIVPDIDRLLPFEVPDAAELSVVSTQDRLVKVVSQLIKRQSQPILMIFEDLHWADDQTLELLHNISLIISDLPIIILGSYRYDESERITKQLSYAKKVSLNRFEDKEVIALSETILGQSITNPGLTDYLVEETKGNALFIIEVFRSLSSLTGSLNNIANFDIPQNLTVNGIMSMLQQRLETIPQNARTLLNYSAAIGNEIDPKLMGYLFPNEDIEQWLLICSEYSVLEATENQWHFIHSRIREYLLSNLESNQQQWQDINREVAIAIETLYANDEVYIVALANHWTQAQQSEKALPYLEKSAIRVAKSAPNLALQFIQTANELAEQQIRSNDNQLALHYSILGNAYYSLGDNDNANIHFSKAIKYMGYRPAPPTNWMSALGLMQQLMVQVAHRSFPKLFIKKKDSQHFGSLVYYALLNAQVVHMSRGEDLQALYTVLLTLNIVESLQPSSEFSLALIYASMTLFTGLAGLHPVARYYRDLTEENLNEGSSVHRTQALALLGVYAFQQAQWKKAVELSADVLSQFEEMGNIHDLDEGRNVLARVYFLSGSVQEAFDLLKSAYTASKDRKDRNIQFALYTISIYIQFQHKEPFGQIEDTELLADTEDMPEMFEEAFNNNESNKALFAILQSAYQYEQKNFQQAYVKLVQSNDFLKPSVERNWNYYELYALLPELCYRLYMGENNSGDWSNLVDIMKSSLKILGKYAKTFVYAQPIEAIAKGWLAEMIGDNKTAQSHYQSAITIAEERETPYIKVLAEQTLNKTILRSNTLRS